MSSVEDMYDKLLKYADDQKSVLEEANGLFNEAHDLKDRLAAVFGEDDQSVVEFILFMSKMADIIHQNVALTLEWSIAEAILSKIRNG